jgi:hypothetical protein
MLNIEDNWGELEEWKDVIGLTATRLYKEYSNLELDDIQSIVIVAALERKDKLDSDKGMSNVELILYKEGKRQCGREVSRNSAVVANYTYSTQDVRRILKGALLRSQQDLVDLPEHLQSLRPKHTRSEANPMHEIDVLDVSIDVRESLKTLPAEDKEIIFSRYALGTVPERGSSDEKRLTRAVRKLTDEMNRLGSGRGKWHEDNPDYVGSRSKFAYDNAEEGEDW